MRGKVSRMGVLLALGTLALVLAGTAASGLFSPVRVASDTLIYAGAADPTYLDPTLVSDGESFRVTAQIFESLVSLKAGSTVIQPGLASKYSSKNGKDWTFTLRKGVKFQDNTPFRSSPSFPPYFLIAVGLWIANDEITSAGRKDDDRLLRWMIAMYLPRAVQPV